MQMCPSLVDVDTFLRSAKDSRAVDADILRQALDEFLAGTRAPDSKGSDVVAFCDYLVARHTLTEWQCNMLARGRSAELRFGNFKLLYPTRGDEEAFAAEDLTTNRQVVLEFGKINPGHGGMWSTIVESGGVPKRLQKPVYARRPKAKHALPKYAPLSQPRWHISLLDIFLAALVGALCTFFVNALGFPMTVMLVSLVGVTTLVRLLCRDWMIAALLAPLVILVYLSTRA